VGGGCVRGAVALGELPPVASGTEGVGEHRDEWRGHFVVVVEGLELAGLCDAGEERQFRRGLERAGFGSELDRDEMEELGFYVCVEDLEDELIRALGAETVEQVLEAHGDLGPFRTLQKQPAWRGQPLADQLRRFMGSGGSRKIRYARLLVEALDLAHVPRPLDGALAHV